MATMITPSTHGGCGCGCGPGQEACDDPAGRERTRFFLGQLVGPEDFTQDQRYFREKHRRHNRMLHGWGVVCGLGVTQPADDKGLPTPFTVCVAPGYVLGPYGDEILVDRTVRFDVRRVADDVSTACPPPVDPWCSPVRVDRQQGKKLYLAIRYDDCPARPVATESGCGCGSECEYSRIVDGFSLGILDTLPDIYAAEEATDATGRSGAPAVEETVRCAGRLRETGRPCPPCPTSPWVILADVVVGTGALTIDEWQHRRFVASFGSYGFYCRDSQNPPTTITGQVALVKEDAAPVN